MTDREKSHSAAISLRLSLSPRRYRYKKCGVMLLDLVPETVRQGDLFDLGAVPDDGRRDRLLAVLDNINEQMGRGTLHFAAEGTGQSWGMRRERLTPGYTSEWGGLVVGRA